ncbi:MAG: hypothetical protein WA738_13095 [Candidatus Angelobacter sp.]
MRFNSAMWRLGVALLAALALQEQNQEEHSAVPTITFVRVWEAFTPQNIDVTIQSTGPAKYISRNPFKPPTEGNPDPEYVLKFTMSAANRDKLFRDARQANFFQGDFSYKKHTVASTGKKTLIYADQARHVETTFDYSENKYIKEITDIFQGLSNTIEYGRKLQFLHRFDKLGLEAELKGMEDAAENHNLAEVQVIAPTLEGIANDPAVLNIARERARRLLAKKSL